MDEDGGFGSLLFGKIDESNEVDPVDPLDGGFGFLMFDA